MFGGYAFMINGNMLCCASKKGLMVRVGEAQESQALVSPYVSPCLGTGRPMRGFIMVDFQGLDTSEKLSKWVSMARNFVDTLPAK
jgi:TfoX/Sxy family transcriptional regulator of competence genes